MKREIYKNLGISATNNESLLTIYTHSDGINLAGIRAVCLKYTNLLFLFRIWEVFTTRQKEYVMVSLNI
jgi:hypothetical protein